MIAQIKKTLTLLSRNIINLFRDGHITIRKATLSNAPEFAELVLLSSPTLFPALYGNEVRTILQGLYRRPRNLFSYEHTFFAELSGTKAGMIIGYDWRIKRRQNLRTGFLLFGEMKLGFLRKLPALMKTRNVIGAVKYGEYYISNLATYTNYQSSGIGTRLICEAEKRARKRGALHVVLDVEADNSGAIKLYEKLGFRMVSESSVQLGKESLRFYRMCKQL